MIQVLPTGLALRAHICLGCLAVPAGVVVGDFLAEGFQLGDEVAEAALVVEPGLVVGELVVGQDPGDGRRSRRRRSGDG